jgi:hypothetical protein
MQPLTGSQLYDLTTSFLDGDLMDETPFYIMLNIVKTFVEARRPWRCLLTNDTTLTASPSDTYLTAKPLPERWISFIPNEPIELYSSTGEIKEYLPSRFQDRLRNKESGPLYWVDVKNKTIGFIGTINNTYTINLNYIEETEEITADTSWAFPARFHPLLAYMVSGMQKGGVDYDDIFARMAPENRANAEILISAMEMWDNTIQLQENNY